MNGFVCKSTQKGYAHGGLTKRKISLANCVGLPSGQPCVTFEQSHGVDPKHTGGHMFSIRQKRQISEAVQQILAETNHPELPEHEIEFYLHVKGAESWAVIKNNGSVKTPGVNMHNELQDYMKRES